MLTVNDIIEKSRLDPAGAHKLVADYAERVGSHRVLQNFRARQGCIHQAMAKPLPGAAGNAFLVGALKIGDFDIYEVFPVHKLCLQAVDSPLIKMTPVQPKDGDTAIKFQMPEFEFQDEWNLCFIFTVDPELLYDVPKSKLKEYIETEARARFKPSKTNAVNASLVNGICSAIMKQFERHMATNVRFDSDIEEQSQKKN